MSHSSVRAHAYCSTVGAIGARWHKLLMSFGHCLVGRLRDQSNMSSTTWPISHLRSFRRLSGGHRRVGRWVRRFLREAVADWFVRDEDVPFMLQVIPIRPERRAQIPGDSRRWHRTTADRRSHQQPTVLLFDRGILSYHRCTDGAQHVIQ